MSLKWHIFLQVFPHAPVQIIIPCFETPIIGWTTYLISLFIWWWKQSQLPKRCGVSLNRDEGKCQRIWESIILVIISIDINRLSVCFLEGENRIAKCCAVKLCGRVTLVLYVAIRWNWRHKGLWLHVTEFLCLQESISERIRKTGGKRQNSVCSKPVSSHTKKRTLSWIKEWTTELKLVVTQQANTLPAFYGYT